MELLEEFAGWQVLEVGDGPEVRVSNVPGVPALTVGTVLLRPEGTLFIVGSPGGGLSPEKLSKLQLAAYNWTFYGAKDEKE